MAREQLALVLRHLHTLADLPEAGETTDAQLLERFVARREESAFQAIVRRHGPLVLSLCRRLLPTIHDAEDAFQATFLVLARKAASIRKHNSVSSWLYGVAYRVAGRAQELAVRRRTFERGEADMMPSVNSHGRDGPEEPAEARISLDHLPGADDEQMGPAAEASCRETRRALDEELCRLPEKYRAPLVLCYLEGHSTATAARRLGLPVGTFKSRLSRAREVLRSQLTRRGIVLAGVALAAELGRDAATAAVRPALLESTTRAALVFAAGNTAAGVSTEAAALAAGVLKTMTLTNFKLTVIAAVLLGVLGLGGGALWQTRADDRRDGDKAQAPTEPQPDKAALKDRHGDPLPPDALARLGTVRWRHGGPVGFVAFLADGKSLLTSAYDNSLRVWDVATGKEVRRIGKADDLVASPYLVSLSADGKVLASCLMDDLAVPAGAAQGLMIRPGQQGVAPAPLLGNPMQQPETVVRLWDPATGKELRQIKDLPREQGAPAMITSLALSSDGKVLATVHPDGLTLLWDTQTGKQLRQLGEKQNLQAQMVPDTLAQSVGATFSPDGKSVALLRVEASIQNQDVTTSLQIWDTATGKELRKIKGPTAHEYALPCFSPDGKTLAWLGGDKRATIHLYEAESGKQVGQLEGKSGMVAVLAFAPDGKLLFARSAEDETVGVWDVKAGKELRRLGKPGAALLDPLLGCGGCLAVSPDGKTLAVAGDKHTVRLLDVQTGKELNPPAGHEAPVVSVRFSRDGKVLTSFGDDAVLRRWESATGKELEQVPIKMPEEMQRNAQVPFMGAGPGVQLSPDGRVVAAVLGEAISLRDVATGKELRKIEGQQDEFFPQAVFSPDGKVLAAYSVSEQSSIRLYDVATGKELRRITLSEEESVSTALVFSPDGKMLASAAGAETLYLWSAETGRKLREVKAPEGCYVQQAVFSPDGRSVLLDVGNGAFSLCEVATGKERRFYGKKPKLDGDGLPVDPIGEAAEPLAFSADGRRLAQGRSDNTIELWDLGTGKSLGRLKGHSAWLADLAFSPDGKRLASGSADTTILVWDVAGLTAAPAGELTARDAEARWADLSADDAAKAFEALCVLSAAPGQAVLLFKEKVRPAAGGDTKRLEQLVSDLDSDTFEVRQKASAELEKAGELAVPLLKKALAGKPSLETTKRIQELLDKTEASGTAASGDRLRSLRVVEVLEKMGTPEARQLLKNLAKGAPGALLTQAALAALERLGQ